MKKFLQSIGFVLLLLSSRTSALTRVSAACGNWNNAATWNPAGAPACGDSVLVLATHTISITTQQNYTGCAAELKILVYGKLMFYNGSKLSLPCNSYVIVFPGAVVDHDEGLANSNLINICSLVEWNSNSTLYGLACLPATRYAPACYPLPGWICELSLQVTIKPWSAGKPQLRHSITISKLKDPATAFLLQRLARSCRWRLEATAFCNYPIHSWIQRPGKAPCTIASNK